MKTHCDFKFLHCKKRIKTFVALVALIAFSCNSGPSKLEGEKFSQIQSDNLSKLLTDLNASDRVAKTMLIIPIEGCSPCIDFALNFVSQNQGKESLTVILSSYSAKASALTLSKYNIAEKSIIPDNDALAVKYDLIKIHPLLLRVNEDNETFCRKLDPDNIRSTLDRVQAEL